MTQRDLYVEKMKLQLDELNAKMTELEAQAHKAKDDARDRYTQEIRKLRHHSAEALAKLDQVKASSADTWATMVADMEKLRDAFTHSFHYFKSQV